MIYKIKNQKNKKLEDLSSSFFIFYNNFLNRQAKIYTF